MARFRTLFIIILIFCAGCFYQEPLISKTTTTTDPFSANEWLKKAYLLVMKGNTNYPLIIHLLNKSLETNPDNYYSYYLRGSTKIHLKLYKAALDDLNKAILLNPDFPDAYTERGYIFANLKNHQAAIADETMAIKLKPDNVITFNNRGFSYLESQQPELALKDLEQAIKIDPTYEEAYFSMAQVYAYLNDVDKAAKYLKLAFDNNYNDLNSIENDGYLQKIKNNPKIRQILKKYQALDQGSTDGVYYYNDYFDLKLELPGLWVITNAALFNSKQKKSVKNRQLLVLNKFPLSYPVDFNASFIVMAEDIKAYGISNLEDYISQLKNLMKKSGAAYQFANLNNNYEIGGKIFTEFNVYLTREGRLPLIHKYFFALQRGYVLGFILSFEQSEDELILKNLLNSIKFES